MNFESKEHKINYLLSKNKKFRQDIYYLLRQMKENDVSIGFLVNKQEVDKVESPNATK